MSDEELIEAMVKIKKHCASIRFCRSRKDCVFFNEQTRECNFEYDAPCDWEYPQGDYNLPDYKDGREGNE